MLAPSGGGLILYQAYGNLCAMTGFTALDNANTKGAMLPISSTFNVMNPDSKTISSNKSTIISFADDVCILNRCVGFTALNNANTKGAMLPISSTFNVMNPDSKTISSTKRFTALNNANTKGAMLPISSTFNVMNPDSKTISSTKTLQPKNMTIIGTKWVFRNKLDEKGIVSRNKARLVAQGYNQHEGINYEETYASFSRLESIRILLAYACALDFKLFQIDVKSAFLNGFINEEEYVAQSLGFNNFEKPDHIYKLKKSLYSLKQASKAWYDRLKVFLVKHEYKMGMVDNKLLTKKKSSILIIVQINVNNIIFGSTCQDICDEFDKLMHDEFGISMMGELNFFLGLQIKKWKMVFVTTVMAWPIVVRYESDKTAWPIVVRHAYVKMAWPSVRLEQT
nr:copia protein [Tanacetum cinerariifolium]